jgi:murein DD-endopeptidase MepM/ murein hydrolase activator NlpD
MKTQNTTHLLLVVLATLPSYKVPAQSALRSEKKTPPIEILEPASKARLSSSPVQFTIKFNVPLLTASFNATLNGHDVSSKFAVTADGAVARLDLQDGLKAKAAKRKPKYTPNLLKVSARALDSKAQFKDEQHFFVSLPKNPGSVTGTVTPDGGQVILPSVATVSFPAGAFLVNQSVEVSATSDPEASALFDETVVMFAAGVRTPYEVRIGTGTNQSLTDFTVSFEIPESFRLAVPTNAEIRVFGQNYWVGETGEVLDTFELFPDRFFPTDAVATLTLPRSLFTNLRDSDGEFEAVLVLGTTPTRQMTAALPSPAASPGNPASPLAEAEIGNATDALVLFADQHGSLMQVLLAATANQTCDGTTLSPPLDGNPTVTSPFGPRDPSVGSSSYHYGTDYRAASGTPVRAMHDGTIEYVRVQRDAAGNDTGWGQYVVINGPAGRTLYAHLQIDSPTVAAGQTVQAGQVIGLSGSSGIGTGPHLHVEYAPNGSIFVRDNKVNPEPCIGRNVSGSVTVRDNGSLADDAFTVSINGQTVCQTQIGASNTCGIGNLRPGTATLTIVAVIAPDDVGTYEVSLAQGLTFSDGTTVRSGTIPQGGSASFTIIVPSQ